MMKQQSGFTTINSISVKPDCCFIIHSPKVLRPQPSLLSTFTLPVKSLPQQAFGQAGVL